MKITIFESLPLAVLIVACVGGCAPVAAPVAVGPTGETSLTTLDVPRAGVSPRVDASDNDPAWSRGVEIAPLSGPIGAPNASERAPTRVFLLWNQEHLFVRFIGTDSEIYLPLEGMQRDREYYRGDVAEIFLDVVGDGKHVFELQVTPANQVFDQLLLVTADRVEYNANGRIVQSILDRDWWKNPGYDMPALRTAAARTADGTGWIIDIAIPASAAMKRLGVKTFEPNHVLRANFLRYDWKSPPPGATSAERVLVPQNWIPVEFGRPHQSPGAMGALRLTDSQS